MACYFFGACLQGQRGPVTGLKAPDYRTKGSDSRVKGSLATVLLYLETMFVG